MSTYNYRKNRIYEVIEKAEANDVASKVFDYTIIILIALNVFAVVLESDKFIKNNYGTYLDYFELFSVIVFTGEYILRVWTADLKKQSDNSTIARVKYIFSFMALIDLLAILPFYLPILLPIDLRFLRILRLSRLLRIFKYNRYSKALNLISKVVKDKAEELIATIFIMCFLILIASTLIYYFESEVQPDAFPNIIASFWWAVATLTTVGYGDIYPITALGKLLASVVALLGIGFVALPTGIISSGFMDEIKKDEVMICPHCNKAFNQSDSVDKVS